MKIAFTALLYGKEYLAWALRSVEDAVDEIHILYTSQPSFGRSSHLVCPDSEDELKGQAYRFVKKPIFWHRGYWPTEGAHRDAIISIAIGRAASQILVVDADEVWAPGAAALALREAADRPEKYHCARFIHFWRSFGWLCRDACMPQRIINVGAGNNTPSYIYSAAPVLHFGYAQCEELIRYKWTCHGHQNELRPGWLESKFLEWKPGTKDVHPTCELDFWVPEATDSETQKILEAVLGDHPYFGKDIIK